MGFLALAEQYSDRFRVIDGHGSADNVAADIYAQIAALTR
jgi:thymidylate kinase